MNTMLTKSYATFSGFIAADGRLTALQKAIQIAQAAKPGSSVVLTAESGLPAAMLGGIMEHEVMYYQPCADYRTKDAYENGTVFAIRHAASIEAAILRCGKEAVSAVVLEPLFCTARGLIDTPSAYFLRVRNICDRYQVALVWDETAIGMGSTGTRFAFEAYGIVPDITIVSSQVFDPRSQQIGLLCHRSLKNTGPTADVPVWVRQGLSAERVQAVGSALVKSLRSILASHKLVIGHHSVGLIGGVRIGQKQTGKPFAFEESIGPRILQLAKRHGVHVQLNARVLDQASGDQLFFTLRPEMTDAEVQRLIKSIRMILDLILIDMINLTLSINTTPLKERNLTSDLIKAS